ncbi:putative serine protease PepD [Agromyces ramosus]|uniref:Putative serine protease PepD n=1 Tax=Agromyces ramosus TaxID=33879 RepID=A0A4Q7MEH3_9MICO|nr:trypsin-like peptidase domain-containing protein [Agromyces ramosus]RZS65803.1 putative serine protease PepD [Agromyces ramosus]
MTDTTDGPTGEAREGDVAATAATNAAPVNPSTETAAATPAAPAESAAPVAAATPAPAAPAASTVPAASAAPAAPTEGAGTAADLPATGTVYQPGQAPQPYHAPQPTAPTQPLSGQVPPAFGGPRPGETQPTAPVAGAQQNGSTTAQAAPKPRRVGLGVAAAIVAAALIGGASGAGITALIAANEAPASSDSADSAQNIVVNDSDSVNQITAVAAKASPSVVTISVTGGQAGGTGSGIILSEDGYVLTNTHVVTLDGATGDPVIQVKTNDGHLYEAELVGTDPLSDLAVIKLTDASGLTPLEFADSDKLNVGDTAIAIGAPLGLSGTVTNGIISALNRSIDVASSAAPSTPDDSTEGDGEGDQGDGSESPFDFFFDLPDPESGESQQPQAASGQVSLPVIQTDAAINPGNSGGALLDSEGKLIGVNVAILSAGGSSTEAGNIGVGFAVPSNLAERIANEIIENGAATHGLLGATVTSAEADGQSDIVGALISEVSAGGAAEQAGLAAGDVVTEFNGVPITDQTDLTAQVRALPGGEKADITFTRDGESQTVSVTLGTFEG